MYAVILHREVATMTWVVAAVVPIARGRDGIVPEQDLGRGQWTGQGDPGNAIASTTDEWFEYIER